MIDKFVKSAIVSYIVPYMGYIYTVFTDFIVMDYYILLTDFI